MRYIHPRRRILHTVAVTCVVMQLVLGGCGGSDDDSAPLLPPPPPAATLPTLAIDDASFAEGQSGAVAATFNVTLSAGSTQVVTVAYATEDGTAAAGSDFIAASGTLTFAANTLTATITVSVQGDTTVEPDEQFFINLERPVNATLAGARAVGGITNDDATATLTMSIVSSLLLTGDSQAIEVNLGAPAGAAGEHVILSSNDEAIAGVTASVDIPAGETAGYVELTTGATAGEATLTATGASGTALLAVDVLQRELELVAEANVLAISQSSPATVTLPEPAGAGGLTVELALSDSARATVTPSSVSIAEGSSSAEFTITAAALGSVSVSAQIGGRPAFAESLSISILHPAPSGAPTSEETIEADLAAGALTEEQAYLYLLYAAYGSESLPPAYRGAPSTLPHTPLMRELGVAAPVTSAEGQNEVARFQIPPIYGDPTAAPTLASKHAGPASWSKSSLSDAYDTICENLRGATPVGNPGWAYIGTPHFRIWYETDLQKTIGTIGEGMYTLAQALASAKYLAAIAEPIYAKLTAHFGKEPLSDAAQPCNGGDGRLDIYAARMSIAHAALTTAYPPGCVERPAWMWIATDWINTRRLAQATFTHELTHMIEFAFGKGTECAEYDWLGEAMAMWAIDFVYPDNNFEHMTAQQTFYFAGYYSFAGEYRARLDRGGDYTVASGRGYCNGYCDYPLLFYVARKFGADRIARIFEFAELYDSIDSLDNAFAPDGGLRSVWPKFALFGWNDWDGGVADEFHSWDKFKGGVKWGHHVPENLILEPQLDTAFERRIDLTEPDTFEHSSFPSTAWIRSLSAAYVNVVLSDERISAITLDNLPALLSSSAPDLRIQAMVKKAGEWSGPEDITATPYKIWCRDAREERIEELLLVYSNASKERRTSGPVQDLLDLQLPPNDFNPKLRVSNAGCLGWKGVVTQTISIAPSYVQTTESFVEFARMRTPGLGDGGVPGLEYFDVKDGFVDLDGSGVGQFGCNEHTTAPRTLLAADDAQLLLRLNAPDDPFNRTVTNTGGFITLPVTRAISCLTTSTGDEQQTWLTLPADGAALSADGRRLDGHTEETTVTGAVITSEWNLDAVRE